MRENGKRLTKIEKMLKSQTALSKEFQKEMRDHESWLKKHDRWFKNFEQRLQLH